MFNAQECAGGRPRNQRSGPKLGKKATTHAKRTLNSKPETDTPAAIRAGADLPDILRRFDAAVVRRKRDRPASVTDEDVNELRSRIAEMLGNLDRVKYAEHAWRILECETYGVVSDSFSDFCRDYLRRDSDDIMCLLIEAEDNFAPFFGWDPPRQPTSKWGQEPLEPAVMMPEQCAPVGSDESTGQAAGHLGAAAGDPFNATGPAVVSLSLSEIMLDPNMQVRECLNKAKVKEYAERKRAGDVFPREVVFEINGRYVLADGWHRHVADEEIGRTVVEVELRHGSIDDALLYAITANSTHGSAWTNKDKRHCVALLLKRFDGMSDRAIADKAKVSHTFVSRMRQELATVASSDTRIGRDMKKRQVVHARKTADSGENTRKPKEQVGGDGTPKGDNGSEPESQRQGRSDATTEHYEDPDTHGDLWLKVEEFLTAVLTACPEPRRREFGKRLCDWAGQHCS
jgi:hypothetical protein